MPDNTIPVAKGRRVVVTGGAGLIGHRLCDLLLEQRHHVVCLDDLSTGREENLATLVGREHFTFVRHDVIDPFPDVGPADLVVHLACLPSPDYYVDRPLQTMRCAAEGTRNALEFARKRGARFILASTSEVYGDPAQHPQRESYWGNVNPIGPRSVYDEGKRYAEALTMAYARQHGSDVGIVRIFNTYGPGMRNDDGRMIPAFIDQALAQRPMTIFGDGSQTRSLCYVDDTVKGIVALAQSSIRGPVNIGNPNELTVLDVAAEIAQSVGTPLSVDHLPERTDDPVRRCPDIGRARDQLGWCPQTSLPEGLRRTVRWFAERNGHYVLTDSPHAPVS